MQNLSGGFSAERNKTSTIAATKPLRVKLAEEAEKKKQEEALSSASPAERRKYEALQKTLDEDTSTKEESFNKEQKEEAKSAPAKSQGNVSTPTGGEQTVKKETPPEEIRDRTNSKLPNSTEDMSSAAHLSNSISNYGDLMKQTQNSIALLAKRR